MIELCESYHIAQQLQEVLAGKTIVDVIANASPHKFAFFFGDPDFYKVRLEGRKINKVISFAGYIEIWAEHMRIQLSENPQIRYCTNEKEYPLKHQLCLILNDESRLYVTAQLYAAIYVCEEGENQNPYYIGSRDKISPLSEAFDLNYFMELVRGSKQTLSMKAFLATEQRIPGFGNGVLQDILFLAGIHPKTKINQIDDEKWKELFHIIKETLWDMARKGGRDTEKDIYGVPGGYQTILSSKTWKEPCPMCKSVIEKQSYLGGAIYFCSFCQPYQEKSGVVKRKI